MVESSLSSFLNWAIPLAVIFLFIAVIFRSFGGGIITFFMWVGKLFGYGAEKASAATGKGYEIVYN